ncbi:MAG: thiamine pyrophosphate-dependent enzyme [Anaerolineae bacterium]
MAGFSKQELLDVYYEMVLIRRFEERSLDLYKEKKIGGVYLHLYNGQEATGVGSIRALKPQDHVITAYRDHGVAISKGVDPNRVMAEMFGKRTGTSGGKGGSMHIADRTHNFWGGYAIVGGHLPLAAGIALKSKYRGEDEVTLSFIGDGATNNGYFHESLNLSAVWDLPVIWLIENNLYGMGTAVEHASGQVELHKRAESYGMKDFGRVDGQDVEAVYKLCVKARDYAVKNGPCLIEAMTYRYEGHGVSDRLFSTRTEEMAFWETKDPIILLKARILETDANQAKTLEDLESQAEAKVEEAVKFAEESPAPDYNDLIANVYA